MIIYMSFVVEIPTVFTKPTQIPARLGNTILTGNETIEGSLYVNGSLTLNNGSEGDSTNVVNYDSLDISNNLNVNGLTTLNEVNVSNLVPEKINGLDAITTIAIAKVQGDGTTDKAVNCSVARNSVGKYTATFSSARPDSNYVVNLSVIESGTDLDVIIITMNLNAAYGSGFTYSIHEGDNGDTAGTLRDRIHQFAVFDTF